MIHSAAVCYILVDYINIEATHKSSSYHPYHPTHSQPLLRPHLFSDTGDLGRINPATGDIIITGRAKDTIVLSNGENVEPQPIEDAIVGTSALVDQAMLVGQDQNYLSAFLVLNPAELARRG